MADENEKPAEPMTQDEMDQLNADPSLLIDNPELEAKLDATLAREAAAPDSEAPEAGQVLPETPVAAAAAPTAAPAAESKPEAKPTFEVPSWFEHVKEEERAGVLEALIAKLPKAERAKLAPVAEMLREVDFAAEQRGIGSATRELEGTERLTSLEEAQTAFENGLYEAIQAGKPFDIKTHSQILTEAAANAKQSELASEVRDGLHLTFQQMGINQIPAQVIADADKAQGLGEALNVYSVFIAHTAFNAGLARARGESKKDAEAAAVVDKARLTEEIMADLASKGLLKNVTAPNITAQSGGGAASELTDDDLRRYEQLVANDPNSVPAELEEKVERQFAAVLSSTK